mgnify:CR=1 FL=1
MKIFNKNEWKKVKLGDICDILDSKRIPISEEKRIKGKYPYYGANGIQGYINDYIFDEELVLLAEDGGNFGSKTKPIAYKISGKTWVNNHAHVLKAKDEIISTDFLLYSLMFYDVTKLITGTTRKKLTRAGMEKITLSIPTLSIQNKITNNLEKIENFIFLRKNQLNFLNELNKSLFSKYSKSQKTKILELGDICEFIKDGTHQTPIYVDNKKDSFKFLSSKDVSKGVINWDNTKYITKELHKELQKKISPKKNDILLAKNGTTGIAALVDKDEVFDIYVSLAILRLKDGYHPKYILGGINSVETNQQFKRSLKGIGVPNLHLSEIKKVKILIPPIELQNKFAERIEKIEKLKFEIEKSIEIAQNLYDSLISKYFGN